MNSFIKLSFTSFERLEDFKGRLFNVRPGEKAEDIIENYQNIIEDIKSRISNNKTKIKTVQDEFKRDNCQKIKGYI